MASKPDEIPVQITNWYDEPVFKSYCFYASLLAIKMLLMASLTAFQRLKRKVFANPEDTMVSGAKVALDDPYVERIRRAHYNDIENILLFISIGFLYSLTKPKPVIAVNLFRIFTIARFLHTVVYTIVIIRQPARALCWMTGYTITIFMAIWCIKSNLAP